MKKLYNNELGKYLDKINLNDKTYQKAGILFNNKNTSHAYVAGDVKNTIVIGQPGCGKTTAVAMNELYTCIKAGHSALVNDNSKCELYKETGALAKEYGYNVICLDFLNYDKDRYNFYEESVNAYLDDDYVRASELITVISETLVAPFYHRKSDPFWSQSAETYIEGVSNYLLEDEQFNNLTLARVAELCNENQADRIAANMYDGLYPMSYPLLEGTLSAPPKTKQSILVSAFMAMKPVLVNEALKKMTSTSTFDLKQIGKEKTIIYICYPEYTTKFNSLISLFIKLLIDELYREASKHDNHELEIPFHFIIDEFASFKIVGCYEYMSTCRSRNIRFTILMQSLEQLKINYSEEIANSIFDICQNVLVFSTNNINTLKKISELSGYIDTIQAIPAISMNELLSLKKFQACCIIDNHIFIRDITPFFELIKQER